MAWTQLKWLLTASVVGILLSARFCGDPLLLFVVGMAPLLLYHFTLNRLAKNELPQILVDSVYYFGFLITIATLAAAIFSYILKWCGPLAIEQISYQFGLGLLATGYALFARLQLMGAVHGQEEADPIKLAEHYADRVREVSDRIVVSAVGFESFANTIMDKNRQIVDAAATTMAQISQGAANAIAAEITAILNETKSSIDQLSRSVVETSLVTDLESLRNQMRSLNGSLTSASTRLKSFEQWIGAVDGKFQELTRDSTKLTEQLQAAIAKLEAAPSLQEGYSQLRDALKELCDQTETVEQQLSKVNKKVIESSTMMGNSYADVSNSMKQSVSDAETAVKSLTAHLIKMVDFIIDETQNKGSRQ